MNSGTLSAWDYVVFASTLLVSVGIGIFYAVTAKKQTTEDYLLGGRHLPWFPVALSMTTSFMSAIIVLGTPSEVYYYGTMYWWTGLTYVIMTAVTCTIYIPLFCSLNLTSCYKYLELRFSKAVKISGTIAYLIQTILYLGLVTYLPALALNQVTSLNLWGSLIATGCACMLYSTIGGIKGIVTADCFQLFIMVTGLISVIVKGSSDAGGLREVFFDAQASGNVIFNDVSFDPRTRHTVWSLLIGGTITWVSNYGIGQSQVQRYLSCRSQKDAILAVVVNCFLLNIILALVMAVGLICAAHFRDCDPWLSKEISRPDQMVPLMVVQKFSSMPGMTGLIISAAYSGTLSTVSTGIHSMGCVVLEDFVRPNFSMLSERKLTLISKSLTLFFGLFTILVAFGASKLSFILQAALSVWGVVGGPLVGVFTLGVFFPFANAFGALIGQLCGFCITLWVAVGAQIYKNQNTHTNKLSTSLENCNFTTVIGNMTSTTMPTAILSATNSSRSLITPKIIETDSNGALQIYFISYLYYGVLAATVTVVVGSVASLLTGGNKTDYRLLCPPMRYVMKKMYPEYENEKESLGPSQNGGFSEKKVEMHDIDNSRLDQEKGETLLLRKTGVKKIDSYDESLLTT